MAADVANCLPSIHSFFFLANRLLPYCQRWPCNLTMKRSRSDWEELLRKLFKKKPDSAGMLLLPSALCSFSFPVLLTERQTQNLEMQPPSWKYDKGSHTLNMADEEDRGASQAWPLLGLLL